MDQLAYDIAKKLPKIIIVEYFELYLGGALSKCWLKSPFWCFSHVYARFLLQKLRKMMQKVWLIPNNIGPAP